MNIAYVDTSCLVAVALGEPGSKRVADQLDRFEILAASNLLEAELRSVFAREQVEADPLPFLSLLTWVHPDRSLSTEYQQATREGDLRGADLWHLACASFLRQRLPEVAFLTLDRRQRAVASALGFPTPVS